MISHEHQCIFVHAPRTGGSSVEQLIWPSGTRTEAQLWGGLNGAYNRHQTDGLQHLTSKQIQLEVSPEVWNDYFTFTFVRNPWDRAVSSYCNVMQREDLRRFAGVYPGTSFKDFMRYISDPENKLHAQWTPQTQFLSDPVDFIGRFETLQDDVRKLMQMLNIPLKILPHRNPTLRGPYRSYYDDEVRDLVAEFYAEDFREFEYRKEFGYEDV